MAVIANHDGLKTFVAHEDGKLITGSVQDCDPYAEAAKEKHLAGDHGSKYFKHAASLPGVLIERYCNTSGIDFHEFMSNPVHAKRMLNDPSLSAFRIWPGKV